MSRHLFFAAPLFLVVLCCAVGGARALESPVDRVTLFERRKTAIPAVDGDGTRTQVFDSFRAPALVHTGEMLVAIASGQFKEGEEKFIGLVARSLFTGEKVWSNGSALLWDRHGKRNFSFLVNPTPVVVNDDVAVVFGGYGASGAALSGATTAEWDFREATGYDAFATAEDPRTTFFKWDKVIRTMEGAFADTSGFYFKEELKNRSLQQFMGSGSAAIRMADKTFVLPVQALRNDGRIVSLVLKFPSPGYGWRLSKGTSAEGCANPAVVEWEKNKLLMITTCDEGYHRVYESTDKGDTWTEAVGALTRVWSNAKKRDGWARRGGFITAEIDGKKVMLFAHSVRRDTGGRGQLRLWMTDNTRILNVGLISTRAEKTGASSLLYRDNQLYCLYEVDQVNSHSLVFANLTKKLGRIRHVLRTWAAVDKSLSERCGAHGKNTGPSGAACVSPIPMTGLVGFLSNESTDVHWYDEYRCVGANVRGATKIPNGLMFKGTGAGAQWPVAKQGRVQRYFFANQGFTLVATVAVHEAPSGVIPVLGASLDASGLKSLAALSITRYGKWRLTYADSSFTSLAESWVFHKEYQVVLSWGKGKATMYLDGQAISDPRRVPLEKLADIKHFVLGGYGTTGFNIAGKLSMTNVLLYNRALTDAEVRALQQLKDTHLVPLAKKETVPVTTVTRSAASERVLPTSPAPAHEKDEDEDENEEMEMEMEAPVTADVRVEGMSLTHTAFHVPPPSALPDSMTDVELSSSALTSGENLVEDTPSLTVIELTLPTGTTTSGSKGVSSDAGAASVSGMDRLNGQNFLEMVLNNTDRGSDSTVRERVSYMLPLLLALCWFVALC